VTKSPAPQCCGEYGLTSAFEHKFFVVMLRRKMHRAYPNRHYISRLESAVYAYLLASSICASPPHTREEA